MSCETSFWLISFYYPAIHRFSFLFLGTFENREKFAFQHFTMGSWIQGYFSTILLILICNLDIWLQKKSLSEKKLKIYATSKTCIKKS